MDSTRTLFFFYATREKHPTFRVDLTELFSAGIARKDHKIDWHMQAMEPSPSTTARLNENERVFIGRTVKGRGLVSKLISHIAGLWHDFRIYRLVRANDYDFVQVRDKMFAGLIGLIAARSRGAPFFYWMSFPYPEADVFRARDTQMGLSAAMRLFYRLRGTLTDWLLYRIVLPRADYIFVQSDQMKKEVVARGISSEKIMPVPMGISLRQVENVNIPSITDARLDGHLTLVYVGTMVRLRRLDFLIEAFKKVHEQMPETVLVMIGSASETDMQFLKDTATRLGVADQVVFTGFVPAEKAWAYVKKATVCLSPIRPSPILDVGTPTKIIEYMIFGRPVVANSHPDQNKVIGESGAGIVVDYSPRSFANAIVDLLSHPDKAEAMGKAGIEYARRHRSYEVLSRELEKKYLELVNAHNIAHQTGTYT